MSHLILGVTGNIAGGKSTVARMLQEKGCVLVDADQIAHDLYAQNRLLVQQLVSEFGPDILSADGMLNRKRLGALVFGKPDALAALNRIVHPILCENIKEMILAGLKVMNRVVLDAALIVELGVLEEMDYLIFVSSPEELRLERLMERNGFSSNEAEIRIASQMPEEGKLQYADFVLQNDGSLAYLAQQVEDVWEEILVREA